VITSRIERHVREQFGATEAGPALDALRRWRISYMDEPPSVRLIAAAVFMADGRREGLDAAFRLGEQDWRDLLVSGGVANADWPGVLDARLGPAPGTTAS
jgi:hypothetical protein